MRARSAVVIGGSMAGLCAARALSPHFEHVTVVDRDVFPEGAQHRKGVPQSRHPHALLDAGRRELERLFPGFEARCLARGGLELNPGLDMATLRQTSWSERRRSPFTLLFASRVLMESVLRDLAQEALSNVEHLESTDVTGLLTSRAGGLRVTGVTVRARDTGERRDLEADLVVDASGRATRVPQWLGELGLPPIEMTVVDAQAGYSSRWYQAPPPADRPADWWWKCLWIEPLVEAAERDPEQYFGVLFPIEGDRWIVTTASWGGRELAKDPETFEHMIANLRTPVLAEAIGKAEPISPVYYRRSMQNQWRHYERWRGELSGLIAIGDSVCGFNPVYGQGMSSASMCARTLERCLDEADPRDPEFPKHFFREQAVFLETPWMMATSRDRERARIEGDEVGAARRLELLGRKLAGLYMAQVAQAAPDDDPVRTALFEVINLTRAPRALFAPGIATRVLRARLTQLLRPSTRSLQSEIPDRPPGDTLG
ncbi:MAG: FAD-dependent oxidoreductase [Myxococcota bacterium]